MGKRLKNDFGLLGESRINMISELARYVLFEVAIDIINNCELMEKGNTTPE